MLRTSLVGLIGLGAGVALERHRRDGPPNAWGRVMAAKPFDPQIGSTSSPPTVDAAKQLDVWSGAGSGGPPTGRVEMIARHGLPSLDTLRSYENFVLSYDRRNRTANWVLEHLTKDCLSGEGYDRSNMEFFEDHSIHEFFRATNADYKGSGYDRGHLAAAGNHRSDQKLVAQTFVLSNISPQVGKGFNRDTWNKLEKYCRWRARRADNLWVCTGPLYLPKRELDGKLYVKYQVIGKNHVSVPTHFFKVLVIEQKGLFDLEAFVMPNAVIDDRTPVESFRVPVDTIERAAGLLFFQRIPRSHFRTINGRSV